MRGSPRDDITSLQLDGDMFNASRLGAAFVASVLVNHTFRWDCVTFCALLIRDGKVSSSLDLNKKLGAAVRPFVAKSFPRGSGYSKNDLNVCFSDVKQLSETKFSAHVEAEMEKKWSSEGIAVNFKVIRSNEGTILKAADIRVLREPHEIRD